MKELRSKNFQKIPNKWKRSRKKLQSSALSILLIISLLMSNMPTIAAGSTNQGTLDLSTNTSETYDNNQDATVDQKEEESVISTEAEPPSETVDTTLSNESLDEVKNNQETKNDNLQVEEKSTDVLNKPSVRSTYDLSNYIDEFIFTDAAGNEFNDSNPIRPDSNVIIKYSFKLPNGFIVKAGDEFTLQIPNYFIFTDFVNKMPLEGDLAGSAVWSVSLDGLLKLEFSQDVNLNNISGRINLSMKVDSLKITEETEDLEFGDYDGGSTYPVKPTIKNVDIKKEVVTTYGEKGYEISDHTILWKLTITPRVQGTSLKQLTVVDEYITSDQEYVAGSMYMDLPSNLITPTKTNDSSQVENGFTYTFSKDISVGEHTIYYKTNITNKFFDKTNPGGELAAVSGAVVSNKVLIKDPDNTTLSSGSASIDISPLVKIVKIVGDYNATQKKLPYSITINHERLTRSAIIEDVYQKNTTLDESSLVVKATDLNDNTVILTKGTDYTLVDDVTNSTFGIYIDNLDGRIIDIEYKLNIELSNLTPAGNGNYYVSNTAAIYRNPSVSNSRKRSISTLGNLADRYGKASALSIIGSTVDSIDIKETVKVDPIKNNTIIVDENGVTKWPATWTVTINSKGIEYNGPVNMSSSITPYNDFFYGHINDHEYIPGTFTVDGQQVSDSQVLTPGDVEILNYIFSSMDNKTHVITFRTYLLVEKINDSTFSSNRSYFNSSSIEYGDVTAKSLSARANISPITPISVAGSYDPNNKNFNWNILVNSLSNRMYMEDVVVTNTIPEDHVMDESSIVVRLKSDPSVEIPYTLIKNPDGTYTFDLTGQTTPNSKGVIEEIEIVFKTTVKDGVEIPEENTNSAYLTAKNSEKLDADATVVVKDTSLEKTTDYYEGDIVTWYVDIARDPLRPLQEQKLVLTDELQPGLSLLETTVHLYELDRTTGDAGSTPIPGGTITYSDSDRIFKYTMPDGLDLTKAYRLTFDTEIKGLESGDKINNSITLTGSKTVVVSSSEEVIVHITGGTVVLDGDKISINLLKLGENDLPLESVPFKIYEIVNGTEKIVGDMETSANGIIKFSSGMFYGHTYYLQETAVAPGYQDATEDIYKIEIPNATEDDTAISVVITKNDETPKTVSITKDTSGYYVIPITIKNILVPSPTEVTLVAKKNLIGKTLTDGMFNFVVKEGTTEVATGSNKADGTIEFTPIEYTGAGTYTYTVTEVNNSQGGIDYDDASYEVSVTVIDNLDGTLTATPTYPSNGIVFTNTYSVSSTSLVLEGTKELTGKTLSDGMFDFVVKEGSTQVATGSNKADGTIEFTAIQYATPGVHIYTVTEVDDSQGGVTYDGTSYTVTVTVVDSGNGTLTATPTYPADGIVFTNTYSVASTNVTLTGTKALTGKTLTDGMFNFVVKEGTTQVATGTNKADGVIEFTTIQYTSAGTHTYTITEVNEALPGVSYDGTSYTVEVEVVDNGTGTLTATPTYPEDGIVFTNTYSVGSTSLVLEGTKKLTGKTLTDGMFDFVVKEGTTQVATGTNKADGTIEFTEIEYTATGVHVYNVTETNGGLGGITYDATSYEVVVTVIDNGNGTLTATPEYPEDGVVFTNTYSTGSTNLTLTGRKELTGKTLTDGMFNFVVKEGTTQVATGNNKADGTIEFTMIEYTSVGTHTYSVTEVNNTIPGISYDGTSYTVEVEVVDNGDGTLTATAEYPEDGIVFTNTYSTGNISLALTGTKELTGKTLTDGMFRFIVKEGTTQVATGSNKADGSIEFTTIQYTSAGTHTYTVTEENDALPGISYDGTSYTVEVDVVDNGDGTLKANPTYPEDGIVFTNTYSVGSINLTLTGTKELTGKTLTDEMFDFVVKEGATQVATGSNKADGTIEFTAIEYATPGVHVYNVTEVDDSQGGITYDGTSFTVTVTVVDNGDGTLTATPTYPADGVVFTNTYSVASTNVTLTGTKELTGKTLTDGMFNFVVKEGTTQVATGSNKADGNIEFSEIQYTSAGTHTYTVTEVNGILPGISYDGTSYTVEVEVVDNGNGTLTATPTYPADGIVFTNTYNVGSINLVLTGTKELTGKTLTDGMFSFVVKEGTTQVATGSNKADGAIEFTAIQYTSAGTHTYTVTEVNNALPGVSYDGTSFTVEVEVVDNGDGTLTANPEYPADGIVFTNNYSTGSINLALTGTKELTGKTLTDGMFSFIVKEGTTQVATGSNKADGSIEFTAIQYTSAGTHTYTVTEENDALPGISYDGTSYTVEVDVVDNGDGTLTANPTYPEDGIVFANTYSVGSINLALTGTKELTGKTLTDGMFDFVVKEGATQVATGSNKADGTIEFTAIEYATPGVHVYNVTEVDDSQGGITYDGTSYTVTVTVVDNGDGTLTATPTYPANGVVFTNTYSVASTNVTLTGTKELTGKTLVGGLFNFIVKEGTTEVATGSNKADGAIEFTAIEYTSAGTHTYSVTEENNALPGVSYDGTSYTVEVEVVDNGDGTLTAIPTYPANGVVFTNTYSVGGIDLSLTATKVLTGKTLTDGMFSFVVKEGTTEVATGSNNASGAIEFTAIPYNSAGTHTYTVTEVNNALPGVSYDGTSFTVEVEVVDNGDGTLTANPTYPAGGIVFTNTYSTGSINLALTGTKELTGKTLTDGMFSFVVKEGTTQVATGSNTAGGAIDFTAIEYTSAGTHTYTVTEVNDALPGVTYDGASYTVEVEVTDNGDGTLTATPTYPSNGIVFTNTYSVSDIDLTLTGTKALTGKTLTDGMFDFVVKEGTTEVATGSNKADGAIEFTAIQYTSAGTHTYTVTEVNNALPGISYDGTSYTVEVEVVDNGDGTLTANPTYPSNGIVFTNTYSTGNINLALTGTKELTGKTLTDGMFDFVVTEGTTEVATGSNTAGGAIDFTAIEYTSAGSHTYTITEVNNALPGISYDGTSYTVQVEVVDNGDGTLTATPTYPANGIVFTNTYSTGSINLALTGTKELTGKTLTDGMFDFVVTEGTTEVATGSNKADGSIEFTEIQYPNAGVHIYNVTEKNDGQGGISYDGTSYTVTVTVIDNGDGTLTATPTYPSNGIVFTNTYSAGSVNLALTGTKALTGKTLTDGMFDFVVKEGTTQVATGSNNASGTIDFTAIEYTSAGTHTYTVTEVDNALPGISYDGTSYTVEVGVVDNGDGTLTATPTYPSNGIVFTNTYSVSSIDLTLTGTKALAGKTLTDGMFDFVVKEGTTEVATGSNNASGAIDFTAIEYTSAGTHTYIVTEVNNALPGISYDGTSYTVEVEVVDNGDGTLTATPTYPANGIVFTNTYSVGSINLALTGTKVLAGKTLTDGMFDFVVKEGTTEVATGSNTAGGAIDFTEIEYTGAGTHTYTITEVNGALPGISYDGTSYTVEVEVVDNGDGTLTATPTYPTNGIIFTNTYSTESTNLALAGTKVLAGKTLTDGMFDFVVTEGTTEVATGSNKADGTIEFTAIEYANPGVHIYNVTEVDDSQGGITYDGTSYTVTVTVVDNGDGTLTATPTYPANGIVFTNTYSVESIDLALTGTKALSGKTLTDGMFSFIVKEGTTEVATGMNKANGSIDFTAIEYTSAGTHTYTVTEVNNALPGISYDGTSYTVEVEVVDNGDGTLTATPTYPANGIAFTNTYSTGSVNLTLSGTKKLTGKELTDGMFSFVVKEGTTEVATGSNKVDGAIKFTAIEYTSAGTYTYTITEVNDGQEGVTYDKTSYEVIVTVVDNGDGTLSAAATYSNGDIIFTNSYLKKVGITDPTSESKDPKNPSLTWKATHKGKGGNKGTLSSVQTGDSADIVLLSSLASLSLICISMMLYKKKRTASK